MTIQEMIAKKQESGYSNEQISALSGVPLGTVQKIFGGITRSPRRETIQKLELLFCKKPETPVCPDHSAPPPSVLRETPAVYTAFPGKRQGEYTIKDYFGLPDDQRAELIDGVLYDMAAPTYIHQGIAGELYLQFANFLRRRKGRCKVFISPISVQLDQDDRTVVEPDLIIICDPSKIRKRVYFGAPDLVVEVLSPSTRKKDLTLKSSKYANAGVREYWIIDPDSRRVMVYDFEHDSFPAIYGSDATVPAGIWNGELEISFPEIYAELEYLYEAQDDDE